MIHLVQSLFVHFQQFERPVRNAPVHLPLIPDLGEVPDPPQQPVGDPRSPARAFGDLLGSRGIDGDIQGAGPTG